MGFACREELAIKGVKPNTLIPFQYTHTINPSVLEINGMTVASTHRRIGPPPTTDGKRQGLPNHHFGQALLHRLALRHSRSGWMRSKMPVAASVALTNGPVSLPTTNYLRNDASSLPVASSISKTLRLTAFCHVKGYARVGCAVFS
jgi:hypothetical protein